MFIVDVRQGSEYASDFEYASVLNTPGLRICRDSEYASGSKYVKVLNACLHGFCFTFTHCYPLYKGTIDCFLENSQRL